MKTKFTLFFLFILHLAQGQFGIQLNTQGASEGYSLFTSSGKTYLVDNCGEIVNEWNVFAPNNHTKLLPNGNLLYMTETAIVERNWDDVIVKSVQLNELNARLDYEVVKLKNGNYLCVGRESITLEKFQEHGYNLNNTYPTLSDIVIEVDHMTGKAVWRWNLFDHIIQDKFPSKKSYGILKDNPGKININAIATYDWTSTESFMINGMDYNEDLDQIVLSVRKIGEIVIIDHSTTTAQAKGSTGGRYNKGGDLIYRYGNPANYGRGASSSQVLYFQHNPNWIKHGVHKGKIIVFNNNLSRTENSTVQIIDPPINADGSYKLDADKPYMPLMPTVEYGKVQNKVTFKSGYTSGASVLPNGNIIITEGASGKLQEAKPDGTVVWIYTVPFVNYIFRTERYEKSHPAFAGKTLIPSGTVEFPSSSYNCNLFSGITALDNFGLLNVVSLPNEIQINIDTGFALKVFNISGQLIENIKSDSGFFSWNHNLSSQVLFLQFTIDDKVVTKKIMTM